MTKQPRKSIMFNGKLARNIVTSMLLLGISLIGAGCTGGSGDTDGGSAADAAGELGTQFVSDGGAGASLIIKAPSELRVGETDGFSVTALDPSGSPLGFIRIFCESEKGIAILEPSSGGVAFEHTSAEGYMSGLLGGLLPGSYILECRAPFGFGLIHRVTIVVRGSIPDGFQGFPGAAGGNLGGQQLQDLTPDSISGEGIFISQVRFTDGPNSTSSSGPLDISRETCDGGTPLDPSDDYTEPFYFNEFQVTLQNTSTQKVIVGTIGFIVQDGGPSSTSTQSKSVVIEPGTTGVVDGILTDFLGGSAKTFAGTTDTVVIGTYRVDIVVTGESDSGEDFTLRQSVTITFDGVNRCGDAG